jgi:hypothetical protein
MSIYEFIEKLNDGEVVVEVVSTTIVGNKWVTEVSISIKDEGLVYETELPIVLSDQATTIALGQYMTELVG